MSTPHNPDNLTPEQIGVAEGWRLLDEDEIGPNNGKATCQPWLKPFGSNPGMWGNLNYVGQSPELTYRTRLTREELSAARGLPPAPASHVSESTSDDEDSLGYDQIPDFVMPVSEEKTYTILGPRELIREGDEFSWIDEDTRLKHWSPCVTTIGRTVYDSCNEVRRPIPRPVPSDEERERTTLSTCTHHTDAERQAAGCPVCMMRERDFLLHLCGGSSSPRDAEVWLEAELDLRRQAVETLRATLAEKERELEEAITNYETLWLAIMIGGEASPHEPKHIQDAQNRLSSLRNSAEAMANRIKDTASGLRAGASHGLPKEAASFLKIAELLEAPALAYRKDHPEKEGV